MSRTGGRVRIQLASQSEQLVEQQERCQQEFLSSPTFQQLVDETSSAKIEETVSVAIEETITLGGFEGRGEGIYNIWRLTPNSNFNEFRCTLV